MTKMLPKLVFIGAFRGKTDEGFAQVSKVWKNYFQQRGHVLAYHTSDVLSWQTLAEIRQFRPSIIHYLTGPTIRSLLMLRFLKLVLLGDVKTVVSATRPFFSNFSRRLVSLLAPDLILTQTPRWETFFTEQGANVQYVPNGVEKQRFRPVSEEKKKALRRKYQVSADAFVILHVGHFRENRGLEVLSQIADRDNMLRVVVGSTKLRTSEQIKKNLAAAGCRIVHEYIEDIQEIYQLSDCYLFPVDGLQENEFPKYYQQLGAIDTPLTVLEAMACNLPVVTTKFGALPRMFCEHPGVFFYDGSVEDLNTKLEEVMNLNGNQVQNEFVCPDWKDVLGQVEEIYTNFALPIRPKAVS